MKEKKFKWMSNVTAPVPWIIKETYGNLNFFKERQNIKKEIKIPLILLR